jgi:hypothetical protein
MASRSAVPASISAFLSGRRIAVAGVSRSGTQPANAIYRRFKSAGYDVVAINPRAREVEGAPCYENVLAVPGALDGVVIVTAPEQAADVVRHCAVRGVRRVWFHRSVDGGSVSAEALAACKASDITAIVGGCPLMFCPPVDMAHRCMKWLFQLTGRVPR